MNLSNGEPPKITYISPFVQERKKKACNCQNRHYILDITNRTVECSVCGQYIDAFDALCDIAERNNKIDFYLENRRKFAEELNKWFKNHKEPIALKNIIEDYRFGRIPKCPKCNEPFDFTEIKAWISGTFYKKKL